MEGLVTEFGSLNDYRKGGVEVIDDDPRNYLFSNVFEVAATSEAYERVAVGKNFEYVIEAARAEGVSSWYSCPHDEFALCLDGKVEIHLIKLDRPEDHVDPEGDGAVRIDDEMVSGRKMGRIVLGRGHMAALPTGAAYRFQADQPSVILFQTIEGEVTVQKWASICQTESI